MHANQCAMRANIDMSSISTADNTGGPTIKVKPRESDPILDPNNIAPHKKKYPAAGRRLHAIHSSRLGNRETAKFKPYIYIHFLPPRAYDVYFPVPLHNLGVFHHDRADLCRLRQRLTDDRGRKDIHDLPHADGV